jgi:hypothetical protein
MFLILFFTLWFVVFDDRINHSRIWLMFAVGKRSLLKKGCEKGGYWLCIGKLSYQNTDIFIGLEIEHCFTAKNGRHDPNSHICPIRLTCCLRPKASLLKIFLNVFTKGLSITITIWIFPHQRTEYWRIRPAKLLTFLLSVSDHFV